MKRLLVGLVSLLAWLTLAFAGLLLGRAVGVLVTGR
jgi:hypothetical protein